MGTGTPLVIAFGGSLRVSFCSCGASRKTLPERRFPVRRRLRETWEFGKIGARPKRSSTSSSLPTGETGIGILRLALAFAQNDKVRFELRCIFCFLPRMTSGVQALHDALGLQFPIHDELGMKATEGFGHVAIPANWTMRGKYFRQLLGTEISPLDGLVVGAE